MINLASTTFVNNMFHAVSHNYASITTYVQANTNLHESPEAPKLSGAEFFLQK